MPPKPCSPKSKYKNMQEYECNEATGRYTLKKGYKKVKDPNAPKRPNNAYMIFYNEKRAEVVAANPGIKPKEVMSRLGQMWRQMGEDQKASYKSTAQSGKETYKSATQGYVKPAVSIEKVVKQKRAKTGYNLYVSQSYKKIQAAHPDWQTDKKTLFAKISKAISDQWKSLPEAEKANFNALAKTAPASAVDY